MRKVEFIDSDKDRSIVDQLGCIQGRTLSPTLFVPCSQQILACRPSVAKSRGSQDFSVTGLTLSPSLKPLWPRTHRALTGYIWVTFWAQWSESCPFMALRLGAGQSFKENQVLLPKDRQNRYWTTVIMLGH